jgi:hypothetical protein
MKMLAKIHPVNATLLDKTSAGVRKLRDFKVHCLSDAAGPVAGRTVAA